MNFKRYFSGVLSLVLALNICLTVPVSANGVDNSLLSVSGGSSHSACVTRSGKVYSWGSNRSYQLGLEDKTNAAAPTEVKGITAISVACGYDFTAALSFGGVVYTWGMNQDKTPKEVNLTAVSKIDAGQMDILALRSDGTVWQWTYGNEPKQVPGLSRIAEISTGGGHNLALAADGCVYAWGNNNYGQIGDGTTANKQTPVKLPLINIVDISAGFSHSLAASYDGKVYAWGSNDYCQLGDGTKENSSVPVQVKNLSGVTRVAAGNGNSMALNSAGNVYTWGYGEFGQLGNGSNKVAADYPSRIYDLNGIEYIDCGVYHCIAVNKRGALYMWGRNRDGQVSGDANGIYNSPKWIRDEIYTDGASQVNVTSGASVWAVPELSALYREGIVFPLLWNDYLSRITRAEFAALLVSTYESLKGNTVHESSTTRFSDLTGHPLESELRKAITLELVNGTSQTTISPDRPMDRQEGAKILCSFIAKVRGVTIPEKLQNLSFYNDANLIHSWAAPYVFYAYENDIMKGGNEGNFDPLGGLTREQGLLVVQRVLVKYDWNK